MINKEKNIEVKITLSKEQHAWLEKQCKITKLTKSKFISWILSKKANEMIEYAYYKTHEPTDQEFEEIIRIIKTPWIKK